MNKLGIPAIALAAVALLTGCGNSDDTGHVTSAGDETACTAALIEAAKTPDRAPGVPDACKGLSQEKVVELASKAVLAAATVTSSSAAPATLDEDAPAQEDTVTKPTTTSKAAASTQNAETDPTLADERAEEAAQRAEKAASKAEEAADRAEEVASPKPSPSVKPDPLGGKFPGVEPGSSKPVRDEPTQTETKGPAVGDGIPAAP